MVVDWNKLGLDVTDAIFEDIFAYAVAEKGLPEDIVNMAAKIGDKVAKLLNDKKMSGADMVRVWKLVASGINKAIVESVMNIDDIDEYRILEMAGDVYQHKFGEIVEMKILMREKYAKEVMQE